MLGLGVRKVIVVSLVGGVFLLANVMFVAHWLNETGVIDWAGRVRQDFLTGTAITVIIALLILLVKPRVEGSVVGMIRRCPVCDHRILGRGSYCPDCGSKVTA
jgi:DNA-directed RNA polymerase subunit RPC12/RpoP